MCPETTPNIPAAPVIKRRIQDGVRDGSENVRVMDDECPAPTERLRFRRYRAADVDSVIEMLSDDEARRWYATKASRNESLAWIRWNLDNYVDDGLGLWSSNGAPTALFSATAD